MRLLIFPRTPSGLFPLLFLLLASAGTGPARAQGTPAYERRELSIPMRDGVTLQAIALVPSGTHAPLPILLIRTPFGAAREFRDSTLPPQYRELAEDGYLFVTEDIRGRFGSGGTFETLRPLAGARGVDESTDAYDTIDWLVRNLPGNNGKVGVLGVSYRGWLAAMAGVHPHPALKVVSPQAPMTDVWRGDDFFHNGAFRASQAVAYAAWIEGDGFEIPDADQYDYYLHHAPLDSLGAAAGVLARPIWEAFLAHPAYDRFWKDRALDGVAAAPTVPTLIVGGTWDAEDLYGPQQLYRTMRAHDPHGLAHFVLGPWTHGGWNAGRGDSIGPVPLGAPTAEYFRAEIQRPFLAYYLHGRGTGRFPAATLFETGAGRWRSFAAWPDPAARVRPLYLRAGGRLTFTPPSARDSSFEAYVSDPASPVPYLPRPVSDEGWATWLAQDQRFLAGRNDVRSWVSAPLAEDLLIGGEVAARLFASTSGTDADWVMKLIDVYPDPGGDPMSGFQLMVNAEILRGRYRNGPERAEPIVAGGVTSYRLDLHQQFYRFRKGHRLMVQVQSSWFPLYDRDPQTFVPNIFHARAADYRPAEMRVWHTPKYPTQILLPVLR